MSISCAYCLMKISTYKEIYMADDKAFCSNRHRDMWNMSNNKDSFANLKINTKKEPQKEPVLSENNTNSPTPNVSANSMISYFLQTLLK